ncbi:hypothetical protein SAMN04488109_6082 [Chryseolinea serpens]|uniref:Probable membrane transporter protein n=1 Tax=Chryseolinea serpens TaxID=947013 RepID=A0A1M5WVU8_9BACT|nr:sulfite exporter TauE/SafE family protein [Chryseolinea serpens]SHH91785.1 hypothetical protein SAMN04488109_6082 [Chryseolinea serpens]
MEVAEKNVTSNRRAILGVMVAAGVLVVLASVFYFDVIVDRGGEWLEGVGPEFFLFVLGGFIAQMIDGSLGMAYGVSASTFLMSFGVPPAAASASVHTAEIFTSGASGLSHLRLQNVNKKLFRSLLLPGIAGAVTGAYLLSSFEEYNYILKPIVATYTLVLGVIIVRKAIRKHQPKTKTKNIPALASFGGFMDSIGGGGWGPIVASTLIAKGRNPRYTIGSVNLAEFFISSASSITFFATIGVGYLHIIVGLILGGLVAAPIAAQLTRKLPVKKIMIIVGVVVILVSVRLIVKAFLA